MPLTFDDIKYATGTADVTNGSATVAASGGALWDGVKIGDTFWCQGIGAAIEAISVDFDEITLALPWSGTTASGAAYVILKDSPVRPTTAEIGAAWEAIRVALAGQGFFYAVTAPRIEPDPSWGKDGDFALKA